MKTPIRFIMAALLPCASFSVISCSSIDAESITTGRVEAGVPGGEVSHTTRVRATVTGIDAANRKVTLVTPEGKKFPITAGPQVANFNQIRIGDQLNATLTDEVIVRMAKPGERAGDSVTGATGVARLGSKPGAAAADSYQITATVTAIDQANHTATLRYSDGSSATLPVRSDVDLSKRRVGEKVVIRATQAFAIRLEKP
jgi:hypothetical protein